jgi:hypothetical protein
MALSSSTLRPGLLVSLKTSIKGNVSYVSHDLAMAEQAPEGASVAKWETERRISSLEEFERGKKARSAARGAITRVCNSTNFGLMCPSSDEDKLDAAVQDARKIAQEFNSTAEFSTFQIYVVAGRVSPDDVEAVRAINSEIRDLMSSMSNGVGNANVEEIRQAANGLRGIGEMLSLEAQTKVEMAVSAGREVARSIKKQEKDGAAVSVDKSAIRRIDELRLAFLDLEDAEQTEAPRTNARAQIDLAAE